MYHLRHLLSTYFFVINILSCTLQASSNIDTILQVIPNSVNISGLYARIKTSSSNGSFQNLWEKDILQLRVRTSQSSQGNYTNAVWALITPKKGLLVLEQDEESGDMTLVYYPSFKRENAILTINSKEARTIEKFKAKTYTSILAPVISVDGQALMLSGEVDIRKNKKIVMIPYQYDPSKKPYYSKYKKKTISSSTKIAHLGISKEGHMVAITQNEFFIFDAHNTQKHAVANTNFGSEEEISSIFKVEMTTSKEPVQLGRYKILKKQNKINCNFYAVFWEEFQKNALTSFRVVNAVSIDLSLFQSLKKLRDVKVSSSAWKDKYEIWYENNHDEVIKITFKEYNDLAKCIIISSMITFLGIALYYNKQEPSEKNTNKGNANSRRTRRLKLSHTK